MSILVIAEVGSTWNWSANQKKNLEMGMHAIDMAADAGADVVKFQWTSNQVKMAERRRVQVPSAYHELNWPKEWHEKFYQYAQRTGVEYACSVYVPEDVAVIDRYVQRFKIASLEALARDMWEAVRQSSRTAKKPILCSTGAMDLSDYSLAYGLIPHGADVAFLHCVAAYPSPVGEMNLFCLHADKADIPFEGLSDHSGHILTGALAAAAGAGIIEVHMRLDRTPKENPDYQHSHAPGRLRQYIENIRLAEAMMGDGHKRVMPSEEALLPHRVGP